MKNKYLLTPYFLDTYLPEHTPLAEADWLVNQPDTLRGESQQERMADLYEPIAAFTSVAAKEGHRAISVAGDCCASLGVLAGLQRAAINPTLIWFDAHGDFNTWETTPSGFLGGMPLAMLVGRGDMTMMEGVGVRPLLESQVILTDARDLDDTGEREAVASSDVVHLPNVSDVLDYNLPDTPLWVHFDVDVLNTATVPAVSYPAEGGPSAAALRSVFQRLADTGQIVAVSVSLWNPTLAGSDQSRQVCVDLLDSLIGKND